jgi:predicted deacylase
MPYHDNEELTARVEALAHRAAIGAEVREIGRTVEGRAIPAVTLAAAPRDGEPPRPQVLLTANIHGPEVISSEVALGILELLCAPAPTPAAASLLELADVTVVPAVNLDSRGRAVKGFLEGRLRASAPRGNSHGVDLNRNFPFPAGAKDVWYPLSGTKITWLPWYRGKEPLSEPETRALADLAEATQPAAAINLHSVGRFFLYPYCYSYDEPVDVAFFRAMGEAFVASQPLRPYRVRQSRSWYAILGDMDDWLYDTFGTLSVTIELSKPLLGVGLNPLKLLNPFYWMNPKDPRETIANTAESCLVALAEGVRLREAP